MAYLNNEYCCVDCGCFVVIDKKESKKQRMLILRCPMCGLGNQFECMECGNPSIEQLSKKGVCNFCRLENGDIGDTEIFILDLGLREN